jgi:two-component system, OmpR family, response regulator
MRILLVEDNVRAGPLLREHLDDAGYTVDLAVSVSEFEEMAKTFRYALYVVDLGLPDGDGRQIISHLRAAKQASPIIVTSARAQVSERVSSLDCGADDYLVKPFHHSELLARIRALLRRTPHSGSQRQEAGTLVAGNLVLDRSNGEITCQGRRITIRPRERRLLTLLMLRAEQPVPKDTIENVVMGEDQDVTPNAVEKVVSRLRATLSEEQARLRIKTIRGLGYMLLKHPICSAN